MELLTSNSFITGHGHGIQQKFNMAWQKSVSQSSYILDGYGEKEICSLKNLAYLEGGAYDKWHRDTASNANNSNIQSKGDAGKISKVVSDPSNAFIPIGHYYESGDGGPGEFVVLLSQGDMTYRMSLTNTNLPLLNFLLLPSCSVVSCTRGVYDFTGVAFGYQV